MSETGSELGGALGIAIIGSVGTALYRSELATWVAPTVPHAAVEAARNTLGAAVAVADRLPVNVGVDLLHSATRACGAAGVRYVIASDVSGLSRSVHQP